MIETSIECFNEYLSFTNKISSWNDKDTLSPQILHLIKIKMFKKSDTYFVGIKLYCDMYCIDCTWSTQSPIRYRLVIFCFRAIYKYKMSPKKKKSIIRFVLNTCQSFPMVQLMTRFLYEYLIFNLSKALNHQDGIGMGTDDTGVPCLHYWNTYSCDFVGELEDPLPTSHYQMTYKPAAYATCINMRIKHGPLTRHVKLLVAHAPGTFSPAADFKGNR